MKGWIHYHSLMFWKISNTLLNNCAQEPLSDSLSLCPCPFLATVKGLLCEHTISIFLNSTVMFLSLMGDTPQLPPDPIHSMNKSGDRRLSQMAHPVNNENQSTLTIPKLLMTKSKTTSKAKQLQSSGCWLVATITQLSTYPLHSALWLGPFTTFASCSQVSLWQQCWGAEAGGGERAVFLLGCLGSLQYCPSSWPPPREP